MYPQFDKDSFEIMASTRRSMSNSCSQKTCLLLLCVFGFLTFFLQFNIFSMFQSVPIPPPVIDAQEGEWTCAGELMNFPSSNGSSIWSRGLPFSCSFMKYLREFKLLSTDKITPGFKIDASSVPFVTYSSSNHFPESRQGIRSLRNILPNRIIYYDIGLTEEEAADIKTVCNLEYRKFNFDKYPDFVRNLMTYSFKPIIMAESFSREPVFWTFDASLRITNYESFKKMYEKINNGQLDTFQLESSTGHTIHAATHYDMYKYFPLLPELIYAPMSQAINFVVRSDLSREVIKWNLLCALTKDCIAPEGSFVNCKINGLRGSEGRTTEGCHRFDQSALSIIMTSLREGRGLAPHQFSDSRVFDGILAVERGSKYRGELPRKC